MIEEITNGQDAGLFDTKRNEGWELCFVESHSALDDDIGFGFAMFTPIHELPISTDNAIEFC